MKVLKTMGKVVKGFLIVSVLLDAAAFRIICVREMLETGYSLWETESFMKFHDTLVDIKDFITKKH